jgi:hypothetical protein
LSPWSRATRLQARRRLDAFLLPDTLQAAVRGIARGLGYTEVLADVFSDYR